MHTARLRRLLFAVIPFAFVAVLAAGGALAALETEVVGGFAEGVWWSLSLMTTVGFAGDTPRSVEGKAISALLMVLGFALLSVATATVASFLVHREEEREIEYERDFERDAIAELQEIRVRIQALERRLAARGEADG